MYPVKYILREVLIAELGYFSESTQEEKVLNIKIRSFSWIKTQKHYVINYIEKSDSIKSITIKKIDYLKLKDGQEIQDNEILDLLESLKSNCIVENLSVSLPKKNVTPIDFNSNWLKDKKVVVTGDAANENYEIVDRKEVIFPIIKKLGGDSRTSISGQTDILITIGDCEENSKYEQAQKWGIHIIDFEKLKQLYKREFKQELKLY